MTAQIADTVVFRGSKYDLIATKGGELLSPKHFGMKPAMLNTACSRGFYATYELKDDALYLREMTLRVKNGAYVPIGGKEPLWDEERNRATYKGLNVPVPFTGVLRLAKGFIRERYVHMGYQKATSYRTIVDVGLQDGRVTEVQNRSREVEQQRRRQKTQADSEDAMRRFEEAFNQGFESPW